MILPPAKRRLLKFIKVLSVPDLKYRYFIPALIYFCSLFLPAFIYAQTGFADVQTFIDSSITRNFLLTSLDNSLLSANFTSKINYLKTFKKINFYAKNFYSSSVTKLNTNLFRDLDNVKSGIGYSFRDGITGFINYSGMFFSDDKNIQLKGTSSNLFYLSGVLDKDYNGALLNSEIKTGYKLEKQIGEYNRGISLGGDMNLTSLELDGYLIDGQAKLLYENLNPRRNTTALAKVSIEKSYQDNLSRNSFDGFFSRIRKDFYFPADAYTQTQFSVNNNIEQRTEYIAKAFDRFDYSVSKKVDFYLTFNPYYRDIYKENYYIPAVSTAAPSIYDTEIQETDLNGEAALKFNLEKFDAQLKASFLARDEKHSLINPNRISQIFVNQTQDMEFSKNNHSNFVKLSSNIYYSISLQNRLEFTGSASLLRYDTPSQENFDDRDELNYLIYFGYKYDNLRNLQLINSVDINLYHTVYILAEKSSNNNWNRVIRFTSKSYFTPFKALRTNNSFSVLANYTVYDFEDLISTVKSYSFRQFDFKDSTNLDISRYFGLDLFGEVKLYDRGELNWREFAEKPLNYFEDRIFNTRLNYFYTKDIVVSGGYRFYEQRRFNYVSGVKTFDSSIKTYGPVGQLRMYISNKSYIEMVASYDYYNYGSSAPRSSNGNLFINVLWNF